MGKITGIVIVTAWLKNKIGKPFTYLEFQNEIGVFAERLTDRFYRIDSFERFFRWALQNEHKDIEINEVPGKWKTWEVKEVFKETLFD